MARTLRIFVVMAAMVAIAQVCASAAGPPDPDAAARDKIRLATMDFYVALNSVFTGDLGPIGKVWSHGSDVTNMSSSGGRATGWSEILDSYRAVAREGLTGKVEPTQIMAVVLGPMGYSTCIESGELRGSDHLPIKVNVRVTNIFRLEAGQWKMVHHHADPMPQSGAAER